MTQTISRIYSSHDHAAAAAAALKKNPQWADDTYLVGAAEAGDGSVDAIAAAIAKAFVSQAEARSLAEAVPAGGAAVIVHAPFGSGVAAIETLERFGPIESPESEPERPVPEWDPATPFSANMMIQVLLNDPAPCSRFWNMPTLTNGRVSLSQRIGFPELTDSTKSLSAWLGWAMLSDKATPLSDWLKIPLLRDDWGARKPMDLLAAPPAKLAAPAESPAAPSEPPSA